MAFVVTSLATFGNTATRSTYTCGALVRAPAANTLLLVSVLVSDTAGTPVQPTDVSGAGITFSLVTSSVTFNTVASPIQNLSVWRGMSATPDSSTVTATFPNNATGCCVQLDEVSGVSTAGTNGANAIGKSATSRSDISLGLMVLAPSATSTANAWYSVLGRGTIDPNTHSLNNFTSVSSCSYLTPSTAVLSAWTTLSSATLSHWTFDVTQTNAGVMVELVLNNPSGAVPGPGNYYHYYSHIIVGEAA